MANFTITATSQTVGSNNYTGYAASGVVTGLNAIGTITSNPTLAGATVAALYLEYIGGYESTAIDLVLALTGDVTEAWCLELSAYANAGTYQSVNATTTTYDGVHTFYTFAYVGTAQIHAPAFRTGNYLMTDCSSTSSGSGGGGDTSADFNCNCESIPLPADGYTIDTLANLRQRVLIRSGYAAQAANPPPGMVLLVNEFLRDAQNQLYRQHFEKRMKRLYSWQMVVNQRYYGFDNTNGVDCRVLDPMSIDWVGFEDLNQAWYPLVCGIDPVLYTRAQISTGWPTHYEIRSCIEIFPAPRAAYTLWIKGRFGLDPFAADTDCTTVDAEAVYLLATGMLKAHYSQPDAQSLLTQALNYTKYLVAGQHDTRRYVPRTRVQTPMTPPRFLPLEE